MKRKFILIATALTLVFTLSGCTKTGTMTWYDWNRARRGSETGTCRIGMKDVVDEDGNKLGSMVYRKRGLTYSECEKLHVRGKRYTWGR